MKTCILLAALVCSAGAAVAGTASERFEIAGLRTGMTEAQVVAALKAHNPALQLQRTMGFYNYRDGVNSHRSPEYLSILIAVSQGSQGAQERIWVMFSSLPGEQRVISVSRALDLQQPPTAAQLEAQVLQKYGPPLFRSARGSGVTLDMDVVWEEAGKPNCWRTTPQDLNVPAAMGSSQGPIADYILNGQKIGRLPRIDPANCGKGLAAKITGDPARRLLVKMSDLGAWAASDLAAARWVDGLRKEAENARLASGKAPKL